ncbi:MAG: general secretion pathway protein GspD [Gammaproteobacteria bacterium]|nr:MAG: general secretion pathway protein GspD [Gammaproteobacteria bacterium]
MNLRCFFCLLLIFLFTACTSSHKKIELPSLPEPLRPAIIKGIDTATVFQPSKTIVQKSGIPQTHFKPTPQALPRKSTSAKLGGVERTPEFAIHAPISVNVDGLPLPAFINEVFGNLLGLSFEIEPKVQKKRELVTLRVTQPQLPAQLYQLAIQVLNNYKVAVLWQGNLMRFVRAKSGQTNIPSLIVDGLTLPHVPASHRPIIQFVPLKVVRNAQVRSWIQKAFKGHNLKIQEDARRNAIILIGTPELVKQAAEAISVLDQPLMRGQFSVRIEPAFLRADVLAKQLINILTAHGYGASSTANFGSIIILPIVETNIIIAFAMDQQILAYVKEWADELDQMNLPKNEINKPGLYLFPVKNTTAKLIANVLNSLLSSANPIATTSTSKVGKWLKTELKLVVDPHRNTLLFTCTGEVWLRLLPILKSMDIPPKQVLIEVTIAEITLSDKDERGVEWALEKANLGGLDGSLSTLALDVSSGGLTYTLKNADNVRAMLNVFTSTSRATILSTPRLMVRSGSNASIDIGTETPILTSQTTSNQQVGGSSAILQQVQYRRTGILLSITPVVYAGRRVDLKISQQVSEARENTISTINSPEIFNRQISTELSLSDGETILLGGLISNNSSEGWRGVPILSDIPFIGQLFRVNKKTADRTELIIMITPYVIDNNVEAKAISEQFGSAWSYCRKCQV